MCDSQRYHSGHRSAWASFGGRFARGVVACGVATMLGRRNDTPTDLLASTMGERSLANLSSSFFHRAQFREGVGCVRWAGGLEQTRSSSGWGNMAQNELRAPLHGQIRPHKRRTAMRIGAASTLGCDGAELRPRPRSVRPNAARWGRRRPRWRRCWGGVRPRAASLREIVASLACAMSCISLRLWWERRRCAHLGGPQGSIARALLVT